MKAKLFQSVFTVFCLSAFQPVGAADLYGHAGSKVNEADYGRLYHINTTSQIVTPLARDVDRKYGPEIQLDTTTNRIYFSTVGFEFENPYPSSLISIDPATGNSTGVVPFSNLPAGAEVTATAMEIAGGRLYGAFHESGPELGDGVLGIINPTTGVVTEIGTLTGMDRPAGGLHYVDGVMYAVGAADSGDSFLFTVNLNTGAATEIAPITLDDTPIRSATALAYADDRMYLFINRQTNLYSVDLTTGDLTLEFDTGVQLNSLTVASGGSNSSLSHSSVPTISTIAMILMAGLLLLLGRRKLAA